MKIGIVSCGPGLPEIVQRFGHSSEWIPAIVNRPGISTVLRKVYANEELKIEDADAWIITGSKYSVYDDIPWIENLESFITKLYNANKSLLGICFGHQMIAQALGGDVKKNIHGWELGSYKISLRDIARSHPLFAGIDNNEIFYESHQDVVVKLPKNAEELAYTKKGNQSFTINSNIFGVQFHPEFSYEVTKALMEARISKGIVVDNTNLETAVKGKDILNNYINFLKERI